jgi:hypothetical protein
MLDPIDYRGAISGPQLDQKARLNDISERELTRKYYHFGGGQFTK